jgi:hypothetical protein
MEIIEALNTVWTLAQLGGAKEKSEVTIIHGDAPGADMIAGKYANDMGFKVAPYPADWKQYGGNAGPIRNTQMLDENPDVDAVFSFMSRAGSTGTQDCITKAVQRGVQVVSKVRGQ